MYSGGGVLKTSEQANMAEGRLQQCLGSKVYWYENTLESTDEDQKQCLSFATQWMSQHYKLCAM